MERVETVGILPTPLLLANGGSVAMRSRNILAKVSPAKPIILSVIVRARVLP